jgi:hypothetical protein
MPQEIRDASFCSARTVALIALCASLEKKKLFFSKFEDIGIHVHNRYLLQYPTTIISTNRTYDLEYLCSTYLNHDRCRM